MSKCNGDCDNCKRPVSKCYGQQTNRKTPYAEGAYRSGEPRKKKHGDGSAVKTTGGLFGGKATMSHLRGRRK